MEEITVCLKDMLECATLQREALNNDDIDTFKELADKRDTYIELMKKIREKETSLQIEDTEIIKAIDQIDTLNYSYLEKEMETIKSQLKEVRQSKYRDNKYMDPYHNLASGRNFIR